MSDKQPKGFYVYQPDPPRTDGRMYAVSGFPGADGLRATVKGLTKPEAQACADALDKLAAGDSLRKAAILALEEMRNTVAPRNSFTDAVDALDAALYPNGRRS